MIFQSTGATSTSSVQHYCYRAAGAKSARLFYRNSASYRAANIAVDWKTRALYVSGTNAGAILQVSIDAEDPESNTEVIIAVNTSANAMGVAGNTLYYVQVSSYGPRAFQSSVLYSCKPAHGELRSNASRSISINSGGRGEEGNPCDLKHATNLSAIPHAFADEFSSISLIAESDASLLFSSQRGNSISRALSRYDVQAKTWKNIHVTPFSNPVALGARTDPSSKKKRLHFIDGSFSTFGSFTPQAHPDGAAPGPFNVPYEITGQFRPLSALGSGQPYPANGASGGWGRQFVASVKSWYWFSASLATRHPDSSVALTTAALWSADLEQPKSAQLLTLAPNATTNLLAIDESKQQAFYVVRVPKRQGQPSRSLCGQVNSGADNLVMASFSGAGGGPDPKVILQQPNGWCFGQGSPALDTNRGLLYFSLQDQYSMFMSTPHLAVLDLATGQSTRMDWGFTINFRAVDHRSELQHTNANCFLNFHCKCGDSGELPLENDDFY